MPLEMPADAVIDAGFDAKVRSAWGRLSADGAISFPFLVPSRFAFVDIKLALAPADRGQGVRRLRMTVDRWDGFAAPSIELEYSSTDRRLLGFSGIGTIRDSEGHNQDVRIVFSPDKHARGISGDEIARAAATPLVRQCAGLP